jgi:hypothetical protein
LVRANHKKASKFKQTSKQPPTYLLSRQQANIRLRKVKCQKTSEDNQPSTAVYASAVELVAEIAQQRL